MNVVKRKVTEKMILQHIQNLPHFLVFFINHEDIHIFHVVLSFVILTDYQNV